ncbi:MAG: hypothetical protein LBV65_02355 [Desulfovibrio sp.]|nr:hypothetical protein [Desulfovibrio sp.]
MDLVTLTAKWGSLLEQDLSITKTGNGIVATAANNLTAKGLPISMSNSQAAQPVAYVAPTVNLSSIMETGTTAKEYEVGVKLASDVSVPATVRNHSNNWKNLTAAERAERKAARREAWNALSDDEKEARKVARQARMGGHRRGSLFE